MICQIAAIMTADHLFCTEWNVAQVFLSDKMLEGAKNHFAAQWHQS